MFCSTPFYRILISFSVLLFVCFQATGQGTVIDSLVQVLQNSEEDTNKVNVLNELAFEYLYADRKQSRDYLQQAITLAAQLDFGEGRRKAQYLDFTVDHFNGDAESAIKKANHLLEEARAVNDLPIQARTLNMMSNIYQSQNNLQKALEVIKKSTEVSIQLGDKNKTGVSYYTTASIYQILKENEIAIGYLEKAIQLFEEDNDQYKLGIAYQGIATCTSGEEAIEYAKRGLEVLEKSNDLQGQGHCHWIIATEYIYLNRAAEALPSIFKALKIFEQVDYPEGIANMNQILGNAYLKLNRHDEAFEPLLKARQIASEKNLDDVLHLVYRNLAEYYGWKGRPDLMSNFLDSFTILQDTLYSREKSQLLLDAETRFQTKEKESQIAQQELELSRQSRLQTIILVSALIAIIALLAIFQYFRIRQQLKRKNTELALEVQKAEARQLRKLDELKSNFFANISHEFRTPLTLILGPLEQMLQNTLKDKPEKYYKIMYRNGKRLLSLVNQLLDLSRIESGRMEMKVAEYDLVNIINVMVQSFESLAEQKMIGLETQLPEHSVMVWCDIDKMEKIIANLLSNAFKFTPEEGMVTVQLKEDDQSVSIVVSDTGIGIPEVIQQNIFDRFYTSGNDLNDMQASSGIGLALTKELIELHNGTITVQSKEEQGSTFYITLLKGKKHFKEQTTFIEPKSMKVAPSSLTNTDNVDKSVPGKILNTDLPIALVVEDNEDIRTYIADQLDPHYRIETAENGKTGLKKALAITPDIIISDVMMPEMNGIDLCSQLKSNDKTSHIPVILLTAKSEQEDKLKGLKTGADDYLTKPFDKEELLIRTGNLIQQRQKLQQHLQNNTFNFNPAEVEISSVDQTFLERLKTSIEEHMEDESFSVVQLGNDLGMSRSQLHRKLKALTGHSPNQLIREMRLLRAKALLDKKAGNTSEIAFMVGFNSLAYFTKCFKDQYGIPPGEYLKKR